MFRRLVPGRKPQDLGLTLAAITAKWPTALHVVLQRLAFQLLRGVVVPDKEAVRSEQRLVARRHIDAQERSVVGQFNPYVDPWSDCGSLPVQSAPDVIHKTIEILEQFEIAAESDDDTSATSTPTRSVPPSVFQKLQTRSRTASDSAVSFFVWMLNAKVCAAVDHGQGGQLKIAGGDQPKIMQEGQGRGIYQVERKSRECSGSAGSYRRYRMVKPEVLIV